LVKKTNTGKTAREMTHRQLSHHKKAQRRQNFIFFGGIGIIVIVVLIIAGGWFAGEYLPRHKTVAQVYDVKYDTSFYIDTLAIYGQSQGADTLASMASAIASQIIQNELIKQEAAKLGVSVTDEESLQYLESIGFTVNSASIELARGALLTQKIKDEYFNQQVLKTDRQLWVKAMMCESESVAWLVREKMTNGENLTELVTQYAVDSASKEVFGDYGWHQIELFKDKFYASFPLDYISRVDVKAGELSNPLADNESYKKIGYWLIRVNERPTEESANVSAILLGSEDEALAVRARLLAGESLVTIADNLSQYSLSQQKHGEMGVLAIGDNVSNDYNAYVFSSTPVIGEWSQPVQEKDNYTRGGYWVVQVAGLEENRAVSAEDRTSQINDLFNTWVTDINTAAKDYMINSLDEEIQEYAVEKATAIINAGS
jgi:parvulin-like peptidyl-prolyl isomerase